MECGFRLILKICGFECGKAEKCVLGNGRGRGGGGERGKGGRREGEGFSAVYAPRLEREGKYFTSVSKEADS